MNYPINDAETRANITFINESLPYGFVERYRDPQSLTDDNALYWAFHQARLGGEDITFKRNKNYFVEKKIHGIDIHGIKIKGNNATIKALGIMPVDPGKHLLALARCSNILIENLNLDGNSQERGQKETGAHLLSIMDCCNIDIERIYTKNAPCDGIHIVATDDQNHNLYCRNFKVKNCSSKNSYRIGLALINCFDGIVEGGSFCGSVGTKPASGIVIEANYGAKEPGNRSIKLYGVRCENNDRCGIMIAGVANAYGIDIYSPYLANNNLAGLLIGNPTVLYGGVIENCPTGVLVWYGKQSRATVIGTYFKQVGTGIKDYHSSPLTIANNCRFENINFTTQLSQGAQLITNNCINI